MREKCLQQSVKDYDAGCWLPVRVFICMNSKYEKRNSSLITIIVDLFFILCVELPATNVAIHIISKDLYKLLADICEIGIFEDILRYNW